VLVAMEQIILRSTEMAPERTRRLLAEVEAWRKANNVKQKDLAGMLGMAPQQLNDILKDRTQPMGEQVLHMLELIKSKPKGRKPKA
jgi:transcriptional regulator with XRE-family HTH domain